MVLMERLAPLVDDLLFPRQAVSGENAGKAPAKKGSKLPLSASIVDMKIDAQQVLGGWCGCLVDDAPGVGHVPEDRSLGTRAGWLYSHLPLLDEMPWGEVAAEEIIAQARLIADVVDPPAPVDAPSPLEVGPVREIVSWCRHLQVEVTERTVRRWCAAGEIPSRVAPDGRLLVVLADVVERARASVKCGVRKSS